jgi:hypothetical protein
MSRCPNCGAVNSGKYEDHGVGLTEYWGSVSDDTHWEFRCTKCDHNLDEPEEDFDAPEPDFDDGFDCDSH